MADVTLNANTNLSALSYNPEDRILLNGYKLTIDVTTINVTEITAAGNAGTLDWSSISATYNFTSPSNGGLTIVQAGTATLWTDASGVTRTITGMDLRGGTAANAMGCNSLRGTFNGKIVGGSANGAHGVGTNYATVTATVSGGAVGNGINSNQGTVSGSVIGGTSSGSYGIYNNASLVNAIVAGGSVNGAHGMFANNNLVAGSVTGGSVFDAHGMFFNYGTITAALTGGGVNGANAVQYLGGTVVLLGSAAMTDAAGAVVGYSTANNVGCTIIARGDNIRCAVPAGASVIYRIGPFHPSANVNGSIPVVDLVVPDFFRATNIR